MAGGAARARSPVMILEPGSPKIGLALSGGGHRAAFFHIGVLAQLADRGLLRPVRVVSTASGGSIVGALYYLHVKALLEACPDQSIEDRHYRQIVVSVERIYRAASARNLRGRAMLNYRRNFRLARPSFSRTDRVAELFDEWFFRPITWEDGEFRRDCTGRSDRLEMQDLLIHPRLGDGSRAADFDPEGAENDGRQAPVPILLLNATTLNTGHSWRFEATHIGEPLLADPPHLKVDHNVRLIRTRYENLPAGRRTFHLGTAVATSAAFPGGFAPKAITDLFEATTAEGERDSYVVELTDGGVHDNQGVDGLLDFGCSTLIVSDAAAQMADVPKPAVRIPAVLSRVGAIARRTSREQRMLYASRAADNVAFMHMQTGLPIPSLPPIGASEATVANSGDPLPTTILPEVQRLLALMRTDLDSFSDLETSSTMLAGYRIARAVIDTDGASAGSEADWRFGSVAGRLDAPDKAYLRRLRVSRARFFKPLALVVDAPASLVRRLLPRLVRNALGFVVAALAALALVRVGSLLAGDMVAAPVLYWVVVAVLIGAIAYAKADLPGLRTASRWLYDSILPVLLSVCGVLSAVSAAFVFDGWLHRGLGREDGVGVFARHVVRTFLARVLPWSMVVVGLAGALLAGFALGLDWIVNAPGSLDDLALAPRLLVAIGIGLALAGVGIVLALRARRHADLFRAVAVALGIAATPVGLVGALFLAAAIRAAFGHRGDIPQSPFWAYVTLVVIAFVVGATVFVVMTLALRLFGRLRGAEAETLPLGVFAVALVAVALLTGLRDQAKTDEALRPNPQLDLIAQRYGRPDVRYDAMLVIDPGSTSGRRLVDLARDPASPLLRPRTDEPRWDTAFGVAVVTPSPTGWLVLQQPTSNRAQLAAALAGVEGALTSQQPGAYGPALLGLVKGHAVRWRQGAVRSVTIVADRPPAPDQLRPPNRASPVPVKLQPAVIQVITPSPPLRPDRVLPAAAVALNLVATRGSRAAFGQWTAWTQGTGGVVLRHRRQASPLDEAEDAVTKAPAVSERALATAYRPLLLFDSEERRPPLDVDAFLAEHHDGSSHHALCIPHPIEDDCHSVDNGLAMAREFTHRDVVLRVNADPSAGDEFQRDTHQRIYYHLTHDAERHLWHIDYWIFYRFNDSPRFSRFTCLSGLAISEGTCFDHEGDWEGVTVTLAGERGALRPESVAYAGHAWRYRFHWDALSAAGAIEGSHPKVWVARGSHASYPMACGKGLRSCRQLGSDVPDGRRDGRKAWKYNDERDCARDHCVIRLPVTRNGGPASWAAFGGPWGMRRCTLGLKLCVRAAGPSSPYFQKRYATPGGGVFADRLLPPRRR